MIDIRALIAMMFLSWSGIVSGQNYPSRPVHLVIGGPAASAPDLATRLLAEKLSESIGQPIVVDNRPGAGGRIATSLVAKSPADGYDLLFASLANLTVDPFLSNSLPYDPEKDLSPISLVCSTPFVLVVSSSGELKSVRDLVAFGKTHGGAAFFGAALAGGASRLAAEMFNQTSGAQFIYVPYQGGPAIMNGLLAGDIQMYFSPPTAVIPLVKSGKLRALGATTDKRLSFAPDIPTMTEVGIPLVIDQKLGLMAPAGTPRAVVDRLSQENIRISRDPDYVRRLGQLGFIPVAGTPEQFAENLREERSRFGELIRRVGIKEE